MDSEWSRLLGLNSPVKATTGQGSKQSSLRKRRMHDCMDKTPSAMASQILMTSAWETNPENALSILSWLSAQDWWAGNVHGRTRGIWILQWLRLFDRRRSAIRFSGRAQRMAQTGSPVQKEIQRCPYQVYRRIEIRLHPHHFLLFADSCLCFPIALLAS